MLKKSLTYTYTNDEEKEIEETAVHWFNIAESEIVDLEVEFEGLSEFLEKMIKEEDNQKLYDMFKRLIQMSYGIRHDDGRRFEKSPEIHKAFSETAAYNALLVEFLTSEQFVADFIIGVFPKKAVKAAEKDIQALLQQNKQSPEPTS